jgi:hypothetical protein
VVFGYRKQAKDNDKLMDPRFLNEMMKSLGYTSSLYEKLPDELFQKSLAELKGIQVEKDEEKEEKGDSSPGKPTSDNNVPGSIILTRTNSNAADVSQQSQVLEQSQPPKPKEENLIELI